MTNEINWDNIAINMANSYFDEDNSSIRSIRARIENADCTYTASGLGYNGWIVFIYNSAGEEVGRGTCEGW